MANNNSKRKNRTNYPLILATVLTTAAVAGAIFLVLTALGHNDTHISDEYSNTPNQSAVSESTESKNNGSSLSEPDNSGIDETSQSYEEYIGVEYAIDITEWEQYIEPENADAYLILVNKTHPLASDYVPANMVDVVYTRKDGRATQKMVYTAEKALQAFLLEAAEYGVTDVTVTSAYRSYSKQSEIFNDNVNKNLSKFATLEECEEYVSTFSARPGTSEHQTGLVCDMHNLSSAGAAFGNTPEAKWLAQNAHRFGFIMRYAEDKTDITRIIYEPWHFRYVGRKAATEMYLSNLCLEEYLENR
ncbi:MAG: hypothetical protein CVU97_07260 [Firmicutes bacterium HGW-Firmicutes-21]|nr:MAG: hypothetical protein CVU97_07260 [Firmicutes bacterium HGW-Firmicutes-21]